MRGLRSHLTYANVVATLALVIAVGGGAAYAADSVFSTDIVNGEVKSVDIGNNQVLPVDVRNDDLPGGGLAGADIADQSGVDTCVSTIRIGQLCFRAENFDRNWNQALEYCADLDLRLPSVAEAMELAQTHDLPDVGATEEFWTDELWGESTQAFVLVDDSGGLTNEGPAALNETVCVTTPTN